MAVCKSHYITKYATKPYDLIWTTNSNTNSIESSSRIYSRKHFTTIINNFEKPEMYHETKGNG